MTNLFYIHQMIKNKSYTEILIQLIQYMMWTPDYTKAEELADHLTWLISKADAEIIKFFYEKEEEHVQLSEDTDSNNGGSDLPF